MYYFISNILRYLYVNICYELTYLYTLPTQVTVLQDKCISET